MFDIIDILSVSRVQKKTSYKLEPIKNLEKEVCIQQEHLELQKQDVIANLFAFLERAENLNELEAFCNACDILQVNFEEHPTLWLTYYFRQISLTTDKTQLSFIKTLHTLVSQNKNKLEYAGKNLCELLNIASSVINNNSKQISLNININELVLFILHICRPYYEDTTNRIYCDFLTVAFQHAKNSGLDEMDPKIRAELFSQLFIVLSNQRKQISACNSIHIPQKGEDSKNRYTYLDYISTVAMNDNEILHYFLIRIILIEEKMKQMKSTDNIYELSEKYKINLPKSKSDISKLYRNYSKIFYLAVSRLLSEFAFHLFSEDENSQEVEEFLELSLVVLHSSMDDLFPLICFAISYRWYITLISKPKNLWIDVIGYFSEIKWDSILELRSTSFGLYQLLKIDYYLDFAIDYVCAEKVSDPSFEIPTILLHFLYKKLNCNESTLMEIITTKVFADMNEFINQTDNSLKIQEESFELSINSEWTSITNEEINVLLCM